jgi:protein gp37
MEASKISWTDATFNPWRGCVKIAPECANCYADTLSSRNPKALGIWGNEKNGGTRVVAAESYWRGPVKWNKLAAAGKLPDGSPNPDGHRPRIFCASLADVFEDWSGAMIDTKGERLFMAHPSPSGPEWWYGEPDAAGGETPVAMHDVRRRLFKLIDATPNLDWMLLTKRPENIREYWYPITRADGCEDHTEFLRPNVWLGTTAGTQQAADRNVPKLLECSHLSPVLWVSAEPLLGPVDFMRWLHILWQCQGCQGYFTGPAQKVCPDCGKTNYWSGSHRFNGRRRPVDNVFPRQSGSGLDWIITGGESGHGARPCHPDWVRSVRDQCQAAGVAFHHKQWGEWVARGQYLKMGADAPIGKLVNETSAVMRRDGGIDESLGRATSTNDSDSAVYRAGKKAAGRAVDGVVWDEFPKVQR